MNGTAPSGPRQPNGFVFAGAGTGVACAWRIVISPMIPQDFPSCYHSSMRNLAVLLIHLIATLARLLGPGGVRSLVAESLLLKHQLLIVNRSRQRSPNLSAGDRILAGLLALLVRPTRLPFCNRTEALDTASHSQSHEQAKIPHAVLIEAPPEARPERTDRRTRSCGRRNEAT